MFVELDHEIRLLRLQNKKTICVVISSSKQFTLWSRDDAGQKFNYNIDTFSFDPPPAVEQSKSVAGYKLENFA